jgi:hypothetical protein
MRSGGTARNQLAASVRHTVERAALSRRPHSDEKSGSNYLPSSAETNEARLV